MLQTTSTKTRNASAEDRRTAPGGRVTGLLESVADAIRRHRAGDRAALTDLVRIVTPLLHAVARGVGLSQYSAEDVVQSTLLALLRHVDTIRTPEAGVAWLVVSARREAIKVARAERTVELVADLGAEDPRPGPGEPDPETIVLERLRRRLLWRHIIELSARGQLILHEIAFGDRPDYAAISRRSGMPLGSIGPTRKRSLVRLRAMLEADPDWACA